MTAAMTIGIVVVACLAARTYSRVNQEQVDLRTHKLRCERRGALVSLLSPPALDDEVPAVNVPVFLQPLQHCLPLYGAFSLRWADPYQHNDANRGW